MTAQTIYSTLEAWEPRYYYIFENITSGKLYVGQTKRSLKSYLGSGPYWVNHCKKHGGYDKENIKLVWCHWFETETEAQWWLDCFENENPSYFTYENTTWANGVREDTHDNPRPATNPEVANKSSQSRMKKGNHISMIGLCWFRNENEDVYCLPENAPDGWWEGRIKTVGTSGRFYFNNGIEQGMFLPGTEPQGWSRGMLPKKITKKMGPKKGTIPWNKKRVE